MSRIISIIGGTIAVLVFCYSIAAHSAELNDSYCAGVYNGFARMSHESDLEIRSKDLVSFAQEIHIYQQSQYDKGFSMVLTTMMHNIMESQYLVAQCRAARNPT